ncbi:mRNA-capping enzyme subunit beta [Ascosphaera acerosa]|nr:mRNA-capping enzyme subunit beta [Ascosphaera acerosa]
MSSPPSVVRPPPQKRRRTRYAEVPIWARRRVRKYGQPPAIPPPEHRIPWVPPARPAAAAQPAVDYESTASLPPSSHQPQSQARPVSSDRQRATSIVSSTKASSTAAAAAAAMREYADGSVRIRDDPSFTGESPREELVDAVAHFLFNQVVERREVGVAELGSPAAEGGIVFEIEAKLGRFIDRDRMARLQLPVRTETIFIREYTGARLQFESTMTSAQHRHLNDFLNKATALSAAPHPDKPRVPIGYVHRRQVDSFYEVPMEQLPPVVQQYFDRRRTPRVRVTRDQESGAVLAKIVKSRVADLDVYSPNTALDWRLSVNIEMSYDGEVDGLPPASEGGGDRIKDRVSYMHMFSQIDLTQVEDPTIPGPAGQPPRFVHELEIEVSAAEIRRQGEKAVAGAPNQYEDLIKSFVDNVRILCRKVPAFDH